ncbi:acetoacetate--CoA ligase [Natribacillus halophilus]|uniref:Acetoacetyl-CoA synthetase n=1 Tax=Natribacillus halophilus TaxID=549003 RepID=A0A1G8KCV1_9BACI|nr:acetoacetate--CoA ligase [Natribacillus halophilus]SDI41238.1 acetoacetyl-CoA synthetase [Natribacillus halophilus]
MPVKEGELLWEPSQAFINQSNLAHYMKWLEDKKGLAFNDYQQLWEWSVNNVEDFWETQWEYFDIKASSTYDRVLSGDGVPFAKWFDGATLNYAEHAFLHARPEEVAIISKSEIRPLEKMTWQTLQEKVASFAAGLKAEGIKSGDRVVAYLPNIPEATIAFLACASIGAVWSSCSPDFGSRTVIDRFQQIEPKLLIAVDGYRYNGKDHDRIDAVYEIQRSIPSLKKTILLPYLSENPNTDVLTNIESWDEFIKEHQTTSLSYTQVPFDHPLWILYSSGTTGLPKAIVQGHGGILLEHLKKLTFHTDLKPEDNFFWYTTTGWMMWNIVVSGLLTGSTIVLYDGSPAYPNMETLWAFAEETEMTVFGTSASYLVANKNNGEKPMDKYDLRHLKSVASTGSPLPPEGSEWVYENIKKDLWLASVSGGTDLCSAFVTGSPLLPVYAGEIQCRALGANVQAYTEDAEPVFDEVGELVLLEPMPSMPLYFWNDTNNERYYSSYFEEFPGIWRHGDWIKITSRGSCQIYGRSDSTINRGGIRMGTSEIYSAVDDIDAVEDSLVIDINDPDGKDYMPLFVVLKEGEELNDELKKDINQGIRSQCSPRHVPNDIFAIDEVPTTLNGKKMEVPIKKLLTGTPVEKAVNTGSMKNPETLRYFQNFYHHHER